MKKLFVFILVIAVIFSVVACKGSSSGEMTAKEIMEKTKVNYEDVKSMSIEADMNIESDSELIPKIEMQMAFDIISEPLEFKATVDSILGNMEMYATNGKIYMQNPATKEWMEVSSEEANLPINPDTSNQFVNVDEKIVENFKVSEKDGLYYLTMEGNDEDIMKSWSDMAGNPPTEDVKPKNVKIEYLIDKEKFLIDAVNFIGEFEADGMNNEKISLKIEMKMRMSNLNGIDKIEIPKEVLDLQ